MSDEKVTEKTITVVSTIEYSALNLPAEDTQTTIERSEKNGLKSCDKLIVKFTRLNTKAVYGSKKDDIKANPEFIANVPKFLEECYKLSESSGDDDKPAKETLQEFIYRMAVRPCQTNIMVSARSEALKLETQNIDKALAQMDSLAQSGKLNSEAIAKLKAMIAAAESQEAA